MTVNTNTKCRVYLTEYGYQTLVAHWNRYAPGYNIPGLIQRRFETQLWDLMNVFGHSLFMGATENPFVRNEIEIERYP